jgi:hypothetical protein
MAACVGVERHFSPSLVFFCVFSADCSPVRNVHRRSLITPRSSILPLQSPPSLSRIRSPFSDVANSLNARVAHGFARRHAACPGALRGLEEVPASRFGDAPSLLLPFHSLLRYLPWWAPCVRAVPTAQCVFARYLDWRLVFVPRCCRQLSCVVLSRLFIAVPCCSHDGRDSLYESSFPLVLLLLFSLGVHSEVLGWYASSVHRDLKLIRGPPLSSTGLTLLC